MPRTRSTVFTHNVPTGTLLIDNQIETPGESVYNINSTAQSYTRTNTMTDEVTPGYFQSIRQGGFLQINPMTQSKLEKWNVSSGSGTTWTGVHSPSQTSKVTLSHPLAYQGLWKFLNLSSYSSQVTRACSTYGFTSAPSPASMSELVTQAIARARTAGLDAGTFAAELDKTISLITRFHTNVFRRAGRIFDAIKDSKSSDLLSLFSETWLEARYGWRTLYYDIEDIENAVNKLKEGLKDQTRAYAKDSSSVSYEKSNTGFTALTSPTSSPTTNNRSKLTYRAVNVYSIERRAGAIVDLLLDEIGFVDPLVTTWEVIPFSFIVDWFTNIGELVSTFSPFANGELLGTWTSERVRVERTVTTTAVPFSTSSIYSVSGAVSGIAHTSWKTYVRDEVTSPPFALSFRLNLDIAKLVDLAALAALRYLGLIRKLTSTTRV